MTLYSVMNAFRRAMPRTFAVMMLLVSPVTVPVFSMVEEWDSIKDFYRTLVRILKTGQAE